MEPFEKGGVVIFGGTFDPIHNGHLALCDYIRKTVSPRRMVLVPTKPFYKSFERGASPQERLEMCRLATEALPDVEVDDFELCKDSPCYTVDTLQEMARRYPDEKRYLLLGDDAFLSFANWYRWRECGALADLLIARRIGAQEAVERVRSRLKEAGIASFRLDNPVKTISSSDIRNALLRRREGEGLLPPAVAAYIRAHGLYVSPRAPQPEEAEASPL